MTEFWLKIAFNINEKMKIFEKGDKVKVKFEMCFWYKIVIFLCDKARTYFKLTQIKLILK